MRRWQIVYGLPLEVWMDIFCFPWISRREFGQIVARIGNFKFAEHAQFYLHEWGKRNLSVLLLYKNCTYINYKPYSLNVPQTPLPANIKSFVYIQIGHFNTTTMDFLDRIRPLLTDLQIDLAGISTDYLQNLRTILTKMAPMMDGAWSLRCCTQTLPVVRQCFGHKWDKLKALHIYFRRNDLDEAVLQENVNTIVKWLTQSSPEQVDSNNGPKLCEVEAYSDDGGLYERISGALRQQFLAAKSPRTFAMNMTLCFDVSTLDCAEFHVENGIGEVLDGKLTGDVEHRNNFFQITRHPANCNTQAVREWIWANTKGRRHGRIEIFFPTIGSFPSDFAQIGVPLVDDDEEEEQQQQQPSCFSQCFSACVLKMQI